MPLSRNKMPRYSGAVTLTGTPLEVSKQLGLSHAKRAIALTLTGEGDERMEQAIADTLSGLAPMVAALVKRRQHEALDRIADAMVPVVPPPERLLTEARMKAQARSAVLESGDWLTASQIAKLAGFSASNTSAQPNKWKKDGLIFAVRHRNTDYFPAYGLDPVSNYRPLKGLTGILDVFGERKDSWSLAYWFASVNSFLGGRRPQDLLAASPDQVLAAAIDEIAEIAHG